MTTDQLIVVGVYTVIVYGIGFWRGLRERPTGYRGDAE